MLKNLGFYVAGALSMLALIWFLLPDIPDLDFKRVKDRKSQTESSAPAPQPSRPSQSVPEQTEQGDSTNLRNILKEKSEALAAADEKNRQLAEKTIRLESESVKGRAEVAKLTERLSAISAEKDAAMEREATSESARVEEQRRYEAATKSMADENVLWRWLFSGIALCALLIVWDANFDRRRSRKLALAKVVPLNNRRPKAKGRQRAAA